MWHVWGNRIAYRFWWRSLKKSDGLGDQGIGGKKYQIKSYRNRLGECRMDLSGSRYGQMAGCCKRGNEPSCFLKYWEFLDQLGNCQLLKDSTSCIYLEAFAFQHRFMQDITPFTVLGRPLFPKTSIQQYFPLRYLCLFSCLQFANKYTHILQRVINDAVGPTV